MVNIDFSTMKTNVINKTDISYLEDLLLNEQGQLKVLPYVELKDVPQNDLSLFCTLNGFYSIPTQELIDFLEEEIGDKKEQTIEIGAGNGVYCRELGIRGTDNYMQQMAAVKSHYELLGQAIVPYGEHVERMDAWEAVRKYRPEIVIAAWVTHKYSRTEHWRGGNEMGVNEKRVLERVKKYIHIGNAGTHGKKPILSQPHKEIKEPWILSRSLNREGNVIYIWGE